MNESLVTIPISWILGAIGALAGAISTLAFIMWSFLKERLAKQDKIIEEQGETIKLLQNDIKRMSRGCGFKGCTWSLRSGYQED